MTPYCALIMSDSKVFLTAGAHINTVHSFTAGVLYTRASAVK